MQLLKKHYQHLSTHLLENFKNEADEPILKYMDLWNEQVNFPELCESFDYPAMFVEYNSTNIQDGGQLAQQVNLLVGLYFCQISYLDSGSLSDAQEEALQYLDYLGRLHELLHGYKHPDVGVLRRAGVSKVGVQTNVVVYRLDFECTMLDEAGLMANRQTDTVTTNAELEFVPAPAPEAKPNWFNPGL